MSQYEDFYLSNNTQATTEAQFKKKLSTNETWLKYNAAYKKRVMYIL